MTDDDKIEPSWTDMDCEGDLDAARAMALETVSLAEPPKFPVDQICGPIKSLVLWGQTDGLHPEAVGPAAMGAVSALLNGAHHSKPPKVQPSLWIAIIGTRSSGKSPAMRHAFEGLMEVDYSEAPFLLTDATCAAVPQEMDNSNGSICILADELTGFLAGLSGTGANGDSQSAASDLSFFRSCWSGAYLRRTRISTGTIIIPSPHLSIVGGLLPGRTNMLGSSRDGDLARWLPSLVPSTTPEAPAFQQEKPADWIKLQTELRNARGLRRDWQLSGDGWDLYDSWRKRWSKRQYGDVGEHVASGLSKAADQAARVAVVFAESMNPAGGGIIPSIAVNAACAVVEYSMRCWAAMLPPGTSAMDYQSADRAVASAVNELMEIVMSLTPEEDGIRRISKRQLMQRSACRIRNGAQMSKLITAYEKINPGTVTTEAVAGGRERVTVREPFRKKPTAN
jgi:hypothetical protein